MRKPGKFWPQVRAKIWEKAESLFMQEQMKTWDLPTKPERCELREGGYFYRAKLIVLRDLWRATKGKTPSELLELEEILNDYGAQVGDYVV